MSANSLGRLDWMDRVKILLTFLVIAVHAAVTYGSEGGWYYQEATEDMVSVVLLTMHNLWFYLSLMREAREAIIAGRYTRFRAQVERAREDGRERAEPTEER